MYINGPNILYMTTVEDKVKRPNLEGTGSIMAASVFKDFSSPFNTTFPLKYPNR